MSEAMNGTLTQASPVDNPDAPIPGQTEEQHLAQEVSSLKSQLDAERKAHEETKRGLASLQSVNSQIQNMLAEMTGHVITLTKALGKLMP